MKRLLWIFVAAGILHACTHKGYIISGELDDADGLKVLLKKMTVDDESVAIDSCVVKKGKFRMKGALEYPEYCVLYVGDHGPLSLLVENTAIHLAVDLGKIQESKVTGSKETDLLVTFYTQMSVFGDSASKVNEDYMSMKLSGETDVEKEKEYVTRMEQIRQQRIEYMKQFASENSNSIVTALIINNNLSYYIETEELEVYADGFDAENKSPWVQNIRDKVEAARRLVIGQPFVDIRLPAPDGNEIALSDYAGKGNYVLIDFWASWCRPCRIANPSMVTLYNKYKDKGFEIVGVSLDRDKTEWVKAIEADALTWPQMSDLKFWQSAGAKLYLVNSIPHTVLLDKDGTILAKNLHPDELDQKLDELIE